MKQETDLDTEQVAAIISLEHADWLGAVVGAVRAGPGAGADAGDLVAFIDDCPEVEGVVDPEEVSLVEGPFDTVLYSWEAAGVVDGDRRLTELGCWLLPRALAWAWNADFDDENPF